MMKGREWLKRYRVFLSLLAINVLIGILWPQIGRQSWTLTKSNLVEMISVIPPIFILLGLLDIWVDRATMVKYTGKDSGVKGMLISFLLGSAAAGPLYAAFPVAAVMLGKGSSVFNVLLFIGAWSTTKIPLLTFEATSMGIRFMITRLVLSVIGITVIAFAAEKAVPVGEKIS